MCAVLGFYAAWNGSFLPTLRNNLSVPYSRIKQSFLGYLTLEAGIDRLFRNVGNTIIPRCVKSQKIANLTHIAAEA